MSEQVGDVLNKQSCPKPSPTAPAGAATSAAGSAPASCPGAGGWTKASRKAQPGPPSRRSARRNGCGWKRNVKLRWANPVHSSTAVKTANARKVGS